MKNSLLDLCVLDIRGLTGVTTFARSCYSWFDWGHHFCMLVFLEASHFPRLGLIDFLLIKFVISGNGKIRRGFDYCSLKFIFPELFRAIHFASQKYNVDIANLLLPLDTTGSDFNIYNSKPKRTVYYNYVHSSQ